MNPFDKYLGSEDKLQHAIINFIRLQYPNTLMTHSPTGIGRRTAFERYKTSYLGVSKGVPDLLIFTPGIVHVGLAMEVKYDKGILTDEQEDWLEELEKYNWMAVWVNSFEKAQHYLHKYFKG